MHQLEESGLTQSQIEEDYSIGQRIQRGYAQSIPGPMATIDDLANKLGISQMWMYCEHGPQDIETADFTGKLGELMESDRRVRGMIDGLLHSKNIQITPPSVKSAMPTAPSLSHVPLKSSLQFAEVTEVQRVLADLLEHESVLAVGTKAQISVKNASTLLDRLASALLLKQQEDSQKGFGASSRAKNPVPEKQSSDHIQSVLPLDAPPDAK